MPPKREREIVRFEFIDNAEREKTNRSKIKAISLSKTQIYLMANSIIGLGILIWDGVDDNFKAPELFGANLPSLLLVLPVLGLIGRATVAGIVEGISKLKGK